MGRTLTFDRESAVRSALGVFWRNGFENASIPELESATGLRRSSIYNAFGSKRGLFDASVQSYLNDVVRPRLKPLTVSDVAPDALNDYLDGLTAAFTNASSMPARHGCLLINAAGSPIAHDADVARIIADYRAELQSAFARGAAAALPHGDAAEGARIASTVTGLVIASFALVRIAPDEARRLIAAAREFLAAS